MPSYSKQSITSEFCIFQSSFWCFCHYSGQMTIDLIVMTIIIIQEVRGMLLTQIQSAEDLVNS